MPPLLTMALPKDLGQHIGNQSQGLRDADHSTPGITQYIPIDPGQPPVEQYATAIPVRGCFPTLLRSSFTYSLSNCRRRPTTAPPATCLFLTM